MRDDVYGYDQQLYDRSFLNCYQRQAMVMLAERVPDLPLVFAGCLVTCDDIADQVIRVGRPKYDFQSDLLDPAALARVGIAREYLPFDTYAQARDLIVDTARDTGYVILFVDVYYLPHTPEYRTDHVVHTITLTSYADGQWSILDDNRASVLCRYTYSEDVIAAAYDNGKLRHVSWFPTGPYDERAALAGSAAGFAEVLRAHDDTYTLLDGVADLLATPWIAPARTIALLYDAFSVYEGSRACLRAFAARQPAFADAEPALADLVGRCRDIRNQLMIGKALGQVDAARVAAACADLRAAEEDTLKRLRHQGGL
ncbi:hypothetical protein [Nonomuraea gerenzanensis]|uniref:Butirosin biosynthesis protein H N-terminal domain-containing protein n=1 Tax=Nonomuraea gerenzanensis TaxID=93944 RepID=A0A1M4EM25_9ACTN|nr:hypothetical protein [Nonomuraea gerenzanensis]UBU11409.1 hypothetical protein LCN96_45010 [Nonomuraea gerenzanensis]SBO99892.1 hypothetical protein BN4615_P9408 [Nonomuraea gerenzanensis]